MEEPSAKVQKRMSDVRGAGLERSESGDDTDPMLMVNNKSLVRIEDSNHDDGDDDSSNDYDRIEPEDEYDHIPMHKSAGFRKALRFLRHMREGSSIADLDRELPEGIALHEFIAWLEPLDNLRISGLLTHGIVGKLCYTVDLPIENAHLVAVSKNLDRGLTKDGKPFSKGETNRFRDFIGERFPEKCGESASCSSESDQGVYLTRRALKGPVEELANDLTQGSISTVSRV